MLRGSLPTQTLEDDCAPFQVGGVNSSLAREGSNHSRVRDNGRIGDQVLWIGSDVINNCGSIVGSSYAIRRANVGKCSPPPKHLDLEKGQSITQESKHVGCAHYVSKAEFSFFRATFIKNVLAVLKVVLTPSRSRTKRCNYKQYSHKQSPSRSLSAATKHFQGDAS